MVMFSGWGNITRHTGTVSHRVLPAGETSFASSFEAFPLWNSSGAILLVMFPGGDIAAFCMGPSGLGDVPGGETSPDIPERFAASGRDIVCF